MLIDLHPFLGRLPRLDPVPHVGGCAVVRGARPVDKLGRIRAVPRQARKHVAGGLYELVDQWMTSVRQG